MNPAEANQANNQPAAAIPANNDQLAQALIALTGVLTNLQGNANRAPVTQDPFASPNAFDLSSRSGESALKLASAPLDATWDGTTANFPAFVVALRIRATEARWNAPDDTGILTFEKNGQTINLLDAYSNLTEADLEAARTTRTNARAIQNSRCFYKAIKESCTGPLKATVFGQVGNLPLHEDGPLLFFKFTSHHDLVGET